MFVDILNNREEVFNKLKTLDQSAKPAFGKMTPQHMIEHLALSVSISNSKGPQKHFLSQEEGDIVKGKIIYTDMELAPGIKNPILGDELAPLRFSDIEAAIAQLIEELNDFDSYFKSNPGAKTIQPRMGLLNHNEWVILHNKHIAHHLRQFHLI